jgi:hypothetical protein
MHRAVSCIWYLGPMLQAVRWRARSPASLTPPSGVLDGRGRETLRRRRALRESQAPPSSAAARIAGVSRPVIMITFVAGDTSRSRACTCSPLVSGIHTSTKARETRWLRACAKKPPRLQSCAPAGHRNRAVAQSNSAPGRRHRECIWNQLCSHWISTYSSLSATLSLRYSRAGTMLRGRDSLFV